MSFLVCFPFILCIYFVGFYDCCRVVCDDIKVAFVLDDFVIVGVQMCML